MPGDPRLPHADRPRRVDDARPRDVYRVGLLGLVAAAITAYPVAAALLALTTLVGLILQPAGTFLVLGVFAGLWVEPRLHWKAPVAGLLFAPPLFTGPLILTTGLTDGSGTSLLPLLAAVGVAGVLAGFAVQSLWAIDQEINGRLTLWYLGAVGIAVVGAWVGNFATGRWPVPAVTDLAILSVSSRYAERTVEPETSGIFPTFVEPAAPSFVPRLVPADEHHDPFGLPRNVFNAAVDHLFRLILGVPLGLLVGGVGRWFWTGLERDREAVADEEEVDSRPDVVADEEPAETRIPDAAPTRPPPPLPPIAVPGLTLTDPDDRPEPSTQVYQPADATIDQPVAPELPPGVLDFGEYEVMAEVGRGGMGRVYKARHRRLGRVVALKTVAGGAPSPAAIERFRGEARAAAQLDHPGIVPVYEFGEHAGQYFFTMAFVEGRSLAARLDEGPLDPTQAAFVVQQAAEATAFAHRSRIVHRDIKPGNIMLDRDGTIRVTDFGLARQLDAADTPDDPADDFPFADTYHTVCRLTRTGAVMGTPAYMAPEQGLDAKQAGPPADVWALGAVLYACLTGRPPFLGATAVETIALAIESDPPRPREINPDIDPDLEAICLRCLEKPTTDRYESAAALAEDLARWRAGKTPVAARVGWWERARRFDAAYPEAAPLVAGVVGHHFGNLQEGIFLGCVLAGSRLPARMPSVQRLILAATVWALVAAAAPLVTVLESPAPTSSGPIDPNAPAWVSLLGPKYTNLLLGLPGVLLSLVAGGAFGLVVTVGVYTIWLTDTQRVWPVRGFRAALFGGLALGLAAVLIYRNVGPEPYGTTVTSFWPPILRAIYPVLGPPAAWLIAVPVGLGVGTLLGRVIRIGAGPAFERSRGTIFLARLAAALAGIAVLAAVPWVFPPGPAVRLDTVELFGPGPLLAACERFFVGDFGAILPTVWPAVFVGKWTVMAVPMLAAGGIGAVLSRRRIPRPAG